MHVLVETKTIRLVGGTYCVEVDDGNVSEQYVEKVVQETADTYATYLQRLLVEDASIIVTLNGNSKRVPIDITLTIKPYISNISKLMPIITFGSTLHTVLYKLNKGRSLYKLTSSREYKRLISLSYIKAGSVTQAGQKLLQQLDNIGLQDSKRTRLAMARKLVRVAEWGLIDDGPIGDWLVYNRFVFNDSDNLQRSYDLTTRGKDWLEANAVELVHLKCWNSTIRCIFIDHLPKEHLPRWLSSLDKLERETAEARLAELST